MVNSTLRGFPVVGEGSCGGAWVQVPGKGLPPLISF